MIDATNRSGLPEPKPYSSFGAKPSSIATAPRKMWNSSAFPPSKFYPLNPSPVHYNPQPQLSERSVCIARAKRAPDDTAHVTPGQGAYSSMDLKDPFTGYATPGSPTRPPSLHKAVALPRSPRKPIPRDGVIGETGQCLDGHVVRSGVPGPQEYTPGTVLFPRNALGAFQSRGERFPAVRDLDLPGPGSYESPGKVKRQTPVGPKLYRRGRNLEGIVADNRNLRRESKAPGPGSYNPLTNPKGRSSGSFRGIPPASAFIMTLEELYGPAESEVG